MEWTFNEESEISQVLLMISSFVFWTHSNDWPIICLFLYLFHFWVNSPLKARVLSNHWLGVGFWKRLHNR